MDYYGNNDYRDYLAHYGVKGMKWGEHKFSSNFYALAKANGAIKKKTTPKWKRSSSYQKYLSKRNAILSKGSKKKNSTLLQLDNNLEKNKGNKAEAASEKTVQNAKDVLKVAKEIIRGKYGSGSKRRAALTKKYGDWAVYQNKVNELLGSKKRHPVGGTTSSGSSKRKSSGGSGGSTVKTTSRSSSRRNANRTGAVTRRNTTPTRTTTETTKNTAPSTRRTTTTRPTVKTTTHTRRTTTSSTRKTTPRKTASGITRLNRYKSRASSTVKRGRKVVTNTVGRVKRSTSTKKTGGRNFVQNFFGKLFGRK